MIFLFWAGVFLFLHSYIVYPLTLPILGWVFKRNRVKLNSTEYKVSILISAYNEEEVIEDKINNCLSLDYPKEQLEIIVGSDGSTDNTNSILDKFSNVPNIKVFKFEERSGKSAVLNKIYQQSTGDILLFCDANTMFLKNALQKLIMNFADPKVGCACGRLILKDSSGSSLGKGESLYWSIESEIKNMEGKLGIVVGANGGIYALRRELFQKIPENKVVMDDFYITTNVLKSGKEVVYEPLAIGSEETSVEAYGEFKRKVRIGHANFNLFFNYLKLLNPMRGLVTYSFLSHKLIRWTGPLFLIAILILNGLILFQDSESIFYWLIAGLQVIFYGSAISGYFSNKNNQSMGLIATIPFYFLSMNFALLMGMFKAILGEKHGSWERIRRSYHHEDVQADNL